MKFHMCHTHSGQDPIEPYVEIDYFSTGTEKCSTEHHSTIFKILDVKNERIDLIYYRVAIPQRPLKPRMMLSADPAMKAPCVARMVRMNLCTNPKG